MLHSKTIVVDDEFASVGSTNLDFRSFEHNFEANMQVYSPDFCKKMADQFLADAKNSERVSVEKWRKRPFMHKAIESIIRLLSPIL